MLDDATMRELRTAADMQGLSQEFAELDALAQPAVPAPDLTNEEIEAVISGMNRKLTGFQGWGWLDVARALLKAQKEKKA